MIINLVQRVQAHFFFGMKYKFNRSNTEWSKRVFKTGLDLVSNNNSWCGAGYFDGHTIDIFAKPGEIMRVKVEAEKYIFKKNHGNVGNSPTMSFYSKRFLRTSIDALNLVDQLTTGFANT